MQQRIKSLRKSQEGFTIIEVMIVLAIAGLIMLIVLLAVPALQRSQRNNARNSDANRIVAAINECLTNHNGQKGSCDADTKISVGTLSELTLPTTFTDSTAAIVGTGSTTAVLVGYQRSCDAAGADDVAGTTRSFVVLYQLEGNNASRCVSG